LSLKNGHFSNKLHSDIQTNPGRFLS
jgi:hypothetical protein